VGASLPAHGLRASPAAFSLYRRPKVNDAMNLLTSRSRRPTTIRHGIAVRRNTILRFERLEDRLLLTAGMLDPTFGDGGRLLASPLNPNFGDNAKSVAVQPDGRVIVAGYTGFDLAVVRFQPDGTHDASFGSNGVATIPAAGAGGTASGEDAFPDWDTTDIALQSDGKIIVTYGFAVARFNANGSLDSGFDGDGVWESSDFGTLSQPTIRSVAIQPDGRIVVAGEVLESFSEGINFAVARLNVDGSFDSSFANAGRKSIDFGFAHTGFADDRGRSVALQSDGKIILGGFRKIDFDVEAGRFLVARLGTDGALDTTFANNGLFTPPIPGFVQGELVARSLAVQADDKIVLAGSFSGGLSIVRIAANGPDGSASSFEFTTISGPSGSASQFSGDYSPDLKLHANGQLLLLGTVSPGGLVNAEFKVARLNSDLTIDTAFGNGGFQVINFGSNHNYSSRMALMPDGRIIIAGTSQFPTLSSRFSLARLTSDGAFDAPFADVDGDGIEDGIDLQPAASSESFNDVPNGGTTTGSIVGRGQQILFVEDQAAPDGVLLTAHPLGGGTPATVSIEDGEALLTLGAGDQVVATHGSVILHVVAGTVEAAFTADNGNAVATASLPAGVRLTFEADTGLFVAAQSNEEPISIVLSSGTVVAIQPGESLNTGLRTVAVDVHPDSVNLNSNGLITVVIFGAADFDAGRVDVGSVRFAGAGAEQWVLVDANQDGRLDLQLKFRREETELDEIYAQLLADDLDGDGVLDSTRQTAEVSVTGQTIDDVLFSGSGSINLFLAGRNLRELLARLFG
jgi:uncharacterized delta-60 repeat protein